MGGRGLINSIWYLIMIIDIDSIQLVFNRCPICLCEDKETVTVSLGFLVESGCPICTNCGDDLELRHVEKKD